MDWIGPGGFVFFTSFVCLALLGAVEGKLFFLNSSTAQAAQAGGFVETGYVDGYWEVEGEWEESLGLVIDQISRSCGLNGSYTIMNAETTMNGAEEFNQKISSCESHLIPTKTIIQNKTHHSGNIGGSRSNESSESNRLCEHGGIKIRGRRQ